MVVYLPVGWACSLVQFHVLFNYFSSQFSHLFLVCPYLGSLLSTDILKIFPEFVAITFKEVILCTTFFHLWWQLVEIVKYSDKNLKVLDGTELDC